MMDTYNYEYLDLVYEVLIPITKADSLPGWLWGRRQPGWKGFVTRGWAWPLADSLQKKNEALNLSLQELGTASNYVSLEANLF